MYLQDMRGLVHQDYSYNSISNYTGITDHHMGVLASTFLTVRDAVLATDRYHWEDKGLGGFGYHYAIHSITLECAIAGELETRRAHVANRNHELIGVMIVMDGRVERPSQAFMAKLTLLHEHIRRVVGFRLPANGHNYWALPQYPTTCPGQMASAALSRLWTL